MSLAQLERAVNARRGQLETLQSRRAELEQKLASIDQEISAIQGSGGTGSTGARRGRPPGSAKAVVRKRRRRRARNQESLQDVVLRVLADNKKGLSLAELQEKVLETGYTTKASNFRNVVYQCIYKMYKTSQVSHDEASGKYIAKA